MLTSSWPRSHQARYINKYRGFLTLIQQGSITRSKSYQILNQKINKVQVQLQSQIQGSIGNRACGPHTRQGYSNCHHAHSSIRTIVILFQVIGSPFGSEYNQPIGRFLINFGCCLHNHGTLIVEGTWRSHEHHPHYLACLSHLTTKILWARSNHRLSFVRAKSNIYRGGTRYEGFKHVSKTKRCKFYKNRRHMITISCEALTSSRECTAISLT